MSILKLLGIILTLQLKQMPHHSAKWSILALGFSFNNFIVLKSSFIRTLSLGIVFKLLQVRYTSERTVSVVEDDCLTDIYLKLYKTKLVLLELVFMFLMKVVLYN